MSNPEHPLAPSEIVILNPASFVDAGTAFEAKMPPLHGEGKFSAPRVGRAAIAAALIALEDASAARLEVQDRKALFGLRSTRALRVLPGTPAAWPAGSLEEQLQARIPADGMDLVDLIVNLLREDRPDPWNFTLDLAKAGLAGRGLLEAREDRVLKFIKTVNYSAPEGTIQLAGDAIVATLRERLARAERERPETWKMLKDAVTSGMDRRRKSND